MILRSIFLIDESIPEVKLLKVSQNVHLLLLSPLHLIQNVPQSKISLNLGMDESQREPNLVHIVVVSTDLNSNSAIFRFQGTTVFLKQEPI